MTNTQCTGTVISDNKVKLLWNRCYKSSRMSNGKQFYIKYKKGKLITTAAMAAGALAGIIIGACCYCCCVGAAAFWMVK